MSCTKLFVYLIEVLRNNSTSRCWINAKIGREQCIAFTTSALTTSCKVLSKFSRLEIFMMCLTLLLNRMNVSTEELFPSSIIILFLKQFTGLSVVSMVYVSDCSLCMVATSDSISSSKTFMF